MLCIGFRNFEFRIANCEFEETVRNLEFRISNCEFEEVV